MWIKKQTKQSLKALLIKYSNYEEKYNYEGANTDALQQSKFSSIIWWKITSISIKQQEHLGKGVCWFV